MVDYWSVSLNISKLWILQEISSFVFLMVFGCFGGLQRPQHWQANQALVKPGGWPVAAMSQATAMSKGCRIVFVFFFFLPQVLFFFWLSFLVPFALYLQQFGTRTCHFAWYLLHFGMVTLHFAWYLLHLAMFAFHFAWYLSHFGISTSHLHGICCILVLQTFMWVSWGFFRLSFRVSFKVSFRVSFRVYLGLHLGFYLGFHLGFHLRVSFRVSFRSFISFFL